MQALTTRIPVKDRDGRIIDEKEVATYAGLLSRAHEEGLKGIDTTLLQVPGPDNGHVAIVIAKVEVDRGTFTGIGDACPENVNRRVAGHIIRMAETRAKARALRDAVNIGVVALEELGGDEEPEASAPAPAPAPRPQQGRPPLRPSPGGSVTWARSTPRRPSPSASPPSLTARPLPPLSGSSIGSSTCARTASSTSKRFA